MYVTESHGKLRKYQRHWLATTGSPISSLPPVVAGACSRY